MLKVASRYSAARRATVFSKDEHISVFKAFGGNHVLDVNGLKIDPQSTRAFADQLWTELHNTIKPETEAITGRLAGTRASELGSCGHGYAGPRFSAVHQDSAAALTRWLTDLQTGVESLAIGAAVTADLLEDSDFDTAEGVVDVVRSDAIVDASSGRENEHE